MPADYAIYCLIWCYLSPGLTALHGANPHLMFSGPGRTRIRLPSRIRGMAGGVKVIITILQYYNIITIQYYTIITYSILHDDVLHGITILVTLPHVVQPYRGHWLGKAEIAWVSGTHHAGLFSYNINAGFLLYKSMTGLLYTLKQVGIGNNFKTLFSVLIHTIYF